jgi:hypothetical protein
MKNAVFWDVEPCRSCLNWCFGGTYRFHVQGRKIRERGTSVSRCLHTTDTCSRWFLARGFFYTEDEGWYFRPIRRLRQNLHDTTSQKTEFFKIFFFSTAPRLVLGFTHPPTQWIPGAVSTGVKWPGRETDLSPPSIAEVKNDEATPALSHMSSWHNG